MPWIPIALSTLRPTTSPHLSVIVLSLSAYTNGPGETMATAMRSDLLRIANEVARIEREFEGAVKFTVTPDARFLVALDTLNVRFSSAG